VHFTRPQFYQFPSSICPFPRGRQLFFDSAECLQNQFTVFAVFQPFLGGLIAADNDISCCFGYIIKVLRVVYVNPF